MSAQADPKTTATTTAANPKAASAPAAPQVQAEDDEFEDFPTEEWSDGETETQHLWDESWDDEDQESSFHSQLKDEMAKLAEISKLSKK